MGNAAEYDLCVIGGGAAGLVVAAGAVTLGAKVALVEKSALGGDCLHHGCIPSKTLIHSAKIAHGMRDAARFGISAQTSSIHLPDVMQRVQGVIKEIEPNDSPERFESLGVKVILGAGQFVAPDVFAIEDRAVSAKNFVIATGTRPAIPPLPGLEQTPYLTNETLFLVQEPIRHLLVLGGGPIGCEMAQALTRLGSRVTLFDQAPRLLPREDEDVSSVLLERFCLEGIDLHLGIRVLQVEPGDGETRVLLEHPEQGQYWVSGSHLLIAAGRKPNLERLGLDMAGVKVFNDRLIVDARLRTSNKHIFACGDVAGPYLFTHMAEHQAGVVLKNALFRWPSKAQIRNIPWCTFTDPELARVGLSESEAQERGIPHRVYSYPFSGIDRAVTEGETTGFAKIVTTPRGKLLGACIVGPHAGELIAEYGLAIARGMKAADLSGTIHVYPTLAEINRRVAEQRLKEMLTPGRKRWLKRIFGWRG